MKKHILFNEGDCPSNMGASQLTEDINSFLAERADILKDAKVSKGVLTFTKQDGTEGKATVTNVPDDFQN